MRLFVALEIPSDGARQFRRVDERSARAGGEVFGKEAALGAARKSSRDAEIYRRRRARKTGGDSRGAGGRSLASSRWNCASAGSASFRTKNGSRVFWAGVDALARIWRRSPATSTQTRKDSGFPREDARVHSAPDAGAAASRRAFRRSCECAGREGVAREFGVLRTSEFHLIESKLKPSGAEYTTLQSFPFAAEA